MKTFYTLLLSSFIFVVLNGPEKASANVSDTIHVSHYNISIDTISFSAKTLRGSTLLYIESKLNGVNNITLNLLMMQIDSITSGSQKLSYTYVANTDIHIATPVVLNAGDTISLRVYYRGSPQQDPLWGGFFFSGSYAFNMGVGMGSDPHSFGKIWYPCVDEFTDHSTYEFHITTSASNKAFCNGVLKSVSSNPNGTKTWHWELAQKIPAYLSSIAVAPFYTMKKTYNGIPVEWAIMASDSVKTKNTFANMGSALSTFVNAYGPYQWDKAGFISVPFNGGAMEHATSIHIGKVFIDGSKNYETLWAHELSHHWWGDLVTCETEGDMWLNEGLASFNESLFLEKLYGLSSYKDNIRSVNRYVLQFAHIDDGGYLSMVNVPHSYTYGTTVYQKGAMVAHTLRNYMGDAKFFQGCKDYMNNRAYANANSNDFRNELATSSGTNLNDFFTDWVSTAGFPQFSIDSTRSTNLGGNQYQVRVYTKQKQKGNSHIYNMLVECNLTDGVNDTTVVLNIDSTTNVFSLQIPFLPNWISLDRNEKICDAISDYEKTISSIGTNAFPETNASLNVINKGSSNSIVRIEHNWVAPDDFIGQNPGIKLSDYHYYKVDGIFSSGFRSKASFIYDGSYGSTGYIDNTLFPAGGKEDSLVILYRKGAGYNWEKVKGYVLNKGISTDQKGSFTIDTLKKGEYVFGYYDISLSTQNFTQSLSEKSYQLKVSPNPVKDLCSIHFSIPTNEKGIIRIIDSLGREVFQTNVYSHQDFIKWDTWQKNTGIYILSLEVNHAVVKTEKIVLER